MESDGSSTGPFNPTTPRITPRVLILIAAIDQFEGTWQAIGRIAPERLSALRRVATIECVGPSTRIDGAALSDREVERLLANLDVRSFASRDEQEVAGHAGVMETVFARADAIDLTGNHVRQLHRDLLRFSEKDGRHRGEYKTLHNHVQAIGADGEVRGALFRTTTPFDTPRLMAELVGWTRAESGLSLLHLLLVIAVFVVVFPGTHPFQDGNGRLSRILTTLLLLRAGYVYLPYLSLESLVESGKEGYYLSLRQTQATIRGDSPDWQPWLLYFLGILHRQTQLLAAKLAQWFLQPVDPRAPAASKERRRDADSPWTKPIHAG